MDVMTPAQIREMTWMNKYRHQNETMAETFGRVADAGAANEKDREFWQTAFYSAMLNGHFLPGGRTLSNAGTGRKNVTFSNCYVLPQVPDSIDGIFDSCKEGALTQKWGGGIGLDFSLVRPKGAAVKGTGTSASGPVSFMSIYHATCKTLLAAGNRRGAQMAVLDISHPDIEDFINAKSADGDLSTFNLSVKVTNAFMLALEKNAEWELTFGGTVYRKVPAKELWRKICEHAHAWSEPGLLFIDTINGRNILQDVETIYATNPCGEACLPAYGACNLVSMLLPTFVNISSAEFDYKSFADAVRVAVRFADNIIDIGKHPVKAQREANLHTRRIGLGFTGLADTLILLNLAYDSDAGREVVSQIMKLMWETALDTSYRLGAEKGYAPVFKELGNVVQPRRNSHLLSIAPAGTISMMAGNMSSGIEPVFEFEYDRKIRQPDGTFKEFRMLSYIKDMLNLHGLVRDRKILKTAADIAPEDHVRMQAVVQRYVDASVSKTINMPNRATIDDIGAAYTLAYTSSCKGVTVHREGNSIGAVLTKESKPEDKEKDIVEVIERPRVLDGRVYKLKLGETPAVYATIADITDRHGTRPYEVFLNTKDLRTAVHMTAVTRILSAALRAIPDPSFLIEELKSVTDPEGGAWVEGKHLPSIYAYLGQVLEEHLESIQERAKTQFKALKQKKKKTEGAPCPQCQERAVTLKGGCQTCTACSWSKCG